MSAKQLIAQLEQMSSGDDKFAAMFTVLGEYIKHHIKEEEGEMFPQLTRAKLDWDRPVRRNERAPRRADGSSCCPNRPLPRMTKTRTCAGQGGTPAGARSRSAQRGSQRPALPVRRPPRPTTKQEKNDAPPHARRRRRA